MPRDGSLTKDRILDVAQELILDRGYGGMSLDAVIENAGITKGAFYYHFDGKAELARELMERFASVDFAHYDQISERAAKLSKDPLQRVLIMVGLFIEELSQPNAVPAGCLYASFCYQTGLLEPDVLEIVRGAMHFWREKMSGHFREIMQLHPPRIEIDADELADQFMVAFEGGFVMTKTMESPRQIIAALEHYRNYLELLFRQD